MTTTITDKPNGKVSGLSITRSGRTFAAAWKVPTSQTADSKHRATGRETQFQRYNTKSKKWVDFGGAKKGISSKSASSSVEEKHWKSPYCGAVRVRVRLYNTYTSGGKTKYRYGDWSSWASYEIKAANAIAIGAPANSSNTVSCAFTATDTSGTSKPRLYSSLTVSRSGVVNGAKIAATSTKYSKFASEASGSFTYSNRDPNALSLVRSSDYVRYEFKATTYGVDGNSDSSSKSFTFRLAGKSAINGAIVANSNVVKVPVKPVSASDTMTLQVGYSTSSIVTSWSDVGTSVSGNSTGLIVPRSEITNGVGEHVFFRVKTSYLGIDAYNQYSDQSECASLFKASGGGTSVVQVVSDRFESGVDSIRVGLGWTSNSNYNGTELSWSDDKDAWRSTKSPDSEQLPDAEWNDGASGSYDGTTSVKVIGLDEDTEYFFRARRYNTADTEIRTGWCEMKSASTGAEPVGVVMYADKTAPASEDFYVSWVVGGSAPQKTWNLKANGVCYSGNGEKSSLVIPASVVGNGDTLSLSLTCTNGSTVALTDSATVQLVKRPVASVDAVAAITALPFNATVRTDAVGTTAKVQLVSMGATSNKPDGSDRQYAGDVVATSSVGAFSSYAEVSVGGGADLIDGAYYYLRVTPYANGLCGDTVETAPIQVAWSHQAVAPSAEVAVDAGSMSAEITVTAPSGAAATDTYSVYRNTVHGVYKVASGLADGATVTDMYAPFSIEGEHSYIVETVTADGDRDWAEASYELKSGDMVVSWDGNTLVLPYDISIGDSFAKDSESTKYLDGTTEGHWNDGAVMSQSLGTNLLKIGDEDRRELVSKLAKYAGSVFVRTPAGHAYEADLTVGSVAYSASNAVVGCSMSATEVMNGRYLAVVEVDESAEVSG